MLESYVIAEVAKILEEAYVSTTGHRLDDKNGINKMAQNALPSLDIYFSHRLKVAELKKAISDLDKQLEKVGQDKGSNDKDYLELTQKHSALLEQNKKVKELLKSLL